MRVNPSLLILFSIWFAAGTLSQPVFGSDIRSAKRDISRLRYQEAEAKLIEITNSSSGEEKQEALLLLAGLKRSVSEAEYVYKQVVGVNPGSRWAKRAELELAKIQYAVGNYKTAYSMLESSAACGAFEEGCYFQGLSALMLKRYDAAKSNLSRVNRGKMGQWAYVSLAEVEMAERNAEEACRRYRAMARAGINPTAMYRYAECLETQDDPEAAARAYDEIIREFENSPEAVLATQKISALRSKSAASSRKEEEPSEEISLSGGYTIQFGSFHDRRNAITLAAQLKRVLPDVRIDSDFLDSREIHRVRYGRFNTRDQAEAAAKKFAGQIGEEFTIMTLP